MAVRFFQHALTFDQAATESVSNKGAQPLHCIGASKRPEILYNLGVAMLHLQRPKEAFECLLVPLNYYHNNPRIWLRLAEACIMVHNHVNIRCSFDLISILHYLYLLAEFKRKRKSKYRFVRYRVWSASEERDSAHTDQICFVKFPWIYSLPFVLTFFHKQGRESIVCHTKYKPRICFAVFA